jgi:uncharacterized membrane protein YkvA (DUF1232 family)
MFKFRKKDPEAKEVRKSKWFKNAKSKAKEYLDTPDKIPKLIEKAKKKAQKKSGPLKEVWEALMTFFRLLKAYAKKEYREIPWESIVLILACVIYLVMPIDLISDFLPGGYIDDATLIAWTMRSVALDIENFRIWEKE